MSSDSPGSKRDVSELRRTARYLVDPSLTALFGPAELQVLDVSASGIRAHHFEPLKVGSSGRLVLRIAASSERFAFRSRVVWSRLSRTATERGRYPYISGLEITDPEEEAGAVIQRLIALGAARPDQKSLERKVAAIEEKEKQKSARAAVQHFSPVTAAVPADQLIMVQQAREWLQRNPTEAKKWYDRARFAMTEETERALGVPLHFKEDVLAIWEYLDRSIDVRIVVRALEQAPKRQ
jgi:hypothetical protein